MNVTPLNKAEAKKAARGEDFTAKCDWFARCTEPAAAVVEHPVLGGVPVCAKHLDFAEGR